MGCSAHNKFIIGPIRLLVNQLANLQVSNGPNFMKEITDFVSPKASCFLGKKDNWRNVHNLRTTLPKSLETLWGMICLLPATLAHQVLERLFSILKANTNGMPLLIMVYLLWNKPKIQPTKSSLVVILAIKARPNLIAGKRKGIILRLQKLNIVSIWILVVNSYS